jgi:hypothetical protein
MKKFLLLIAFTGAFWSVQAQTVLNEVYTEPNAGKEEFFELYNSGAAGQSVDCFTLLIYWKTSNTVRGWYVLDLPNDNVASKGFYVGAAADPFDVQSQAGVDANFNWNAANFRDGSTGGYLKKYQLNGTNTGYTDVTASIPVTLNDLFADVSVGGGHNYITLVYVNGAFNNGFWGGGSGATLPAEITGMAALPVDMSGACSDFNASFGSLVVEAVNQSPGVDNGFARLFDGKCGAWDKTSAQVNHTPGVANGTASGQLGDLTTAQFISCNTAPGVSTVRFNISGVTGSATVADDFPVEVQLYYDFGTIGTLDGADVYQSSQFVAGIAEGEKTFIIQQTQPVILIYRTKRGCFDKVVSLINGCIALPVNLKSFNATRSNSSTVMLKWETMSEENSAGFAIERNVAGTWQQVAYVPTKAQNGYSQSLLTYTFVDANNIKGITQYRLRQEDLDNKIRYSAVRAVRGEGQIGKTVVYPNPSLDGKVNVVFEDASVKRDVSVIDLGGRVIRQWKAITNNNLQIDNLSSGIYTIRISVPATGEMSVEKVVVNKR